MEVIAGKNSVKESLLFSPRLKEVFLIEDKKRALEEVVSLAKARKIKVNFLKRKDFYNRFPYPATQGVAALVEPFSYLELADLLKKIGTNKDVVLVILDGVEDPQNFGSLLRTIECLGGDGVIIRKKRSVKVTTAVYKVSAGAAEKVPIAMVNNITAALKELKKEGFWIFGAEAGVKKTVFDVEFERKIALVLGSEGHGLSRLVKKECDYLFSIPLKGKIGSLNVAVAGAILLYEIMRRKNENQAFR